MSKQAPDDRGQEGKKGTRSLGNTFVFLYFPICQFSHNLEHERRPTTRTKREKLLRLFLCAAAAFPQLVASHADTNINYDIRWKCLLFCARRANSQLCHFYRRLRMIFSKQHIFYWAHDNLNSDKLTSACTLSIPLIQIITLHGWLGISFKSFSDIVSDENFIFCHIPQVIKEWLAELLSSHLRVRSKWIIHTKVPSLATHTEVVELFLNPTIAIETRPAHKFQNQIKSQINKQLESRRWKVQKLYK